MPLAILFIMVKTGNAQATPNRRLAKKNVENINIEEYTVALWPFIESLIISSVDHTGPCRSCSALYVLF